MGALLACTVTAAHAAAPAYPSYPVARSLPAMADWLRANTDVQLGSVVAIGDDAVFSLEPTTDAAPAPTVRATIRQEVTSAAFAASLGGRSAVMVADLDCAGRQMMQRALDLYAGNNRQGAVRQLGGGGAWQPVPTGTFMGSVLEAVCDPDFQPIFPAGQVRAPASAEPSLAPGPVAAFEAPPRLARRPRTAAAPTSSIPLIAPIARPAAAAPSPPASSASTPSPPSTASPRSSERPATPTMMAAAAPDGPIATQPTVRPALIAPPGSQASRPSLTPPITAPAGAPLPPAPPASRAVVAAPLPPPVSSPDPQPHLYGWVDLGAYASLEAATEAWRAASKAFAQAFEGRRQRVQLQMGAAQPSFRLYAEGFSDPVDVAAFCEELRAGGRACSSGR